ncbi:MAG TPA: sigma 54-interacting transcriptional regulator [Polyangiaceae bacterium LLY-WYZ-15_(1-7)]|nr:sigma 54-interacting transcriptional regulator [Polyangiaceae bacterium LLY-WYZ-15_(1-7)]HJL06504.1 sigma 54-interacting transcriptional regulator [Polyangiaceae bacterium LLY-WYZ-15_(1-7)]HJL09055.1 sigma 54-interacting transcriptional regulator [Polyangiaceae bacterium LLY-WYZ-15_(1-7)]HJL21720.1 sigma 54-interacting transcriptional regulator [Polyangiaceae bacterium LLY-WYZ-15_(1-7)]HJL33024.1 sigma 54-interacting transcriptional regulator [Polyangiaceae bacterium LLY-WYZ-15_(1-7)]
MSDNPGLTTIFVDKKATKRRLKKAKLRVEEGPDAGKELVMDRERVTLGRSVICDLVLADKAVSGTHAEVIATERGFLLKDLESTNGTRVGDLRIREVWIKPGTVIAIGQTRIRFQPEQGEVEIELSGEDRFFDLVGKSVRMREIFAVLEKVAAADLTVLIRGETGTGKELVARAIHQASPRAEHPLVVQDCSAIPKDLIESTLFGHERGAFTGATDRHKGSFEQAEAGTIFLDEIGELDLALQPKLLRVLENREVKRVGGDKVIPVHCRVVAATNRDLRQMVNEGTFREDLYYRLSVVQVELPALRERPEDVPLLVDSFLADFARRLFPDEPDKQFSVTPEAMTRLKGYPWPGNVRELKNTIERAAAMSDGMELGVRDLMPSSQKTPAQPLPGGTAEQFVEEDVPFKEAKQKVLDTFEAAYLKALLDKHGGNITRSAQAAGLTRYHLRELAKRYGVRDSGGGSSS